MTSIFRRGLLTGAASSALALGTAGLALPPFAQAPMLGPARPTFRRFALGNFEVTTLLDGAVPVADPHTIFGTDQNPETVAALLAENDLPAAAAEFTFIPVLVNTGENLILFDTGNGEGARPSRGLMSERLAAAGYSIDQVDTVVLTHMHPDHIGGIMEGGAPAFPNARYVTGATEYDFFSNTDRIGSPAEGIHQLVVSNVASVVDKMTFVNPGDSVASGVEAVGAFGHTPGHMVWHIESEGQRLLLAADIANHFVLSLQRPDWEVRFDMDKSTAAATRKEIFGMVAADSIPFIGYHMPFPGVGYLTAQGEGFRYEPASYQLNI